MAYWSLHYLIQGFTSPIFLSLPADIRFKLILTFIFWIMLITGSYRFIHQKFNLGNTSIQFTTFQIVLTAIIMTVLDILCRFKINGLLFASFLGKNSFTYDANNIYGRVFADNVNTDTGVVLSQFSNNSQGMKFMAYLIWIVAYNLYHIALNTRRHSIEKLAAENRAKDLELINLRSQLNPHFLFNALNSIHSLALMKKDTASDAVLLLSDLMRYTLNYEKRDVVPLSDEIEVVGQYLQLEKIRFGKKLNTEVNIADDTLAIEIPPIIVQTLVENAIKHGLRDSTNGVFIKIESYLTDNFLTIDIINSGQLKKATPSVYDVKNSGIGVENTRRRLQMIYGETAVFKLKNRNETEVIATLKLPIN
jgi:hypothetical protein